MDTTYLLEVTMNYGNHSNFTFATYEEAKAIHDKLAPLVGDRYSNDAAKKRVTFECGDGIATIVPTDVMCVRVVDKAKFEKLVEWENDHISARRATDNEALAHAIAAAVNGYARLQKE